MFRTNVANNLRQRCITSPAKTHVKAAYHRRTPLEGRHEHRYGPRLGSHGCSSKKNNNSPNNCTVSSFFLVAGTLRLNHMRAYGLDIVRVGGALPRIRCTQPRAKTSKAGATIHYIKQNVKRPACLPAQPLMATFPEIVMTRP